MAELAALGTVTARVMAAQRTALQAEHVYADIDRKRQTTHYLHSEPLLAGDVPELG